MVTMMQILRESTHVMHVHTSVLLLELFSTSRVSPMLTVTRPSHPPHVGGVLKEPTHHVTHMQTIVDKAFV
jgi:hypothetical protein